MVQMANELVGSIEKRRDKYRLRVTVGYNELGNPIRKSKIVDAPNDRKAYNELDKWIAELEKNGYKDFSTVTFKYFYENHWKKDAVTQLEPRAYGDYRKTIEKRLLPKLGNKRLLEIKPHMIQEIINDAKRLDGKETELSYYTKKKILNVASSVFNLAMISYRMIEGNPAKDVRIKKNKSEKKKIQEPYSLSEIQVLLEKINQEHVPLDTRALILTAFITGAREGELAALEHTDIDFSNKKVTFHQRITRALSEDNSKWKYYRADGTKTGSSVSMSVPDDYLQLMCSLIQKRESKQKELEIKPKHNYIFGHINGSFSLPTSLYRKWRRFCKEENIRFIRFHDLRHTTASFLIADPDIPIKVIQERLGHKDYRTTVNMYASALEESDKLASDAFSKITTSVGQDLGQKPKKDKLKAKNTSNKVIDIARFLS